MKRISYSLNENMYRSGRVLFMGLIIAANVLSVFSCDPRKSKSKRNHDKVEEKQDIPRQKTIRKDLPDGIKPIGTSTETKKVDTKVPPVVPKSPNLQVSATASWMRKTKKILGYYEALSQEDIDGYAGKPRELFLEHMFAHENFPLAVLDFSMFFLGDKIDSLFELNSVTMRSDIENSPSAVYAALAFDSSRTGSGDFFDLLDYQFRFVKVPPNNFAFPVGNEFADSLGCPQLLEDNQTLPMNEFFDKCSAYFLQQVQKPHENMQELCENVKPLTGDPNVLSTLFFSVSLNGFSISFYTGKLEELCQDSAAGIVNAYENAKKNLNIISKTIVYMRKMFHAFKPFDLSQKRRMRLSDLYEYDDPSPSDFGLELADATALSSSFWSRYLNSSTNFNRSRAEAILDRYFCEKLIPLQVPLSQVHENAGNTHVNDPACYSCHYKLDPMAGFFKDHGIVGINMKEISPDSMETLKGLLGFEEDFVFVFDDRATLDAEQWKAYKANWVSQGNDQTAYIRSATDDTKNSSGSSLADLFKIIKTAPEVKQCIVKRAIEYFIAPNMNMDAEWMQKISDGFIAHGEWGNEALKWLISELAASHAFQQVNPIETTCYDLENQNQQGPPCEVAFVLKNNCTNCHSGNSPSSGLDFSNWEDSGAGYAQFRDSSSQSRNGCEIMTAMQKTLNTDDKLKQMPPGGGISTKDKDALYTWLENQLEKDCKN